MLACRWWADGGPLLVVFWSSLPSSTKKDPLWQNFLEPRMSDLLSFSIYHARGKKKIRLLTDRLTRRNGSTPGPRWFLANPDRRVANFITIFTVVSCDMSLCCSTICTYKTVGCTRGVATIHWNTLSRDVWYPTMWYFDKCRLRGACAASF